MPYEKSVAVEEWHRGMGAVRARDFARIIKELEELKHDYKKCKDAFRDFEYALNDAYANKRVSSFNKAEEYQKIIGDILQKAAAIIPAEAISIKRLMQEFEHVWNYLLAERFNKIFVIKRRWLVFGQTLGRTWDAPTHFSWVLDQLKRFRKVWARFDDYIDQAIRETTAAARRAA